MKPETIKNILIQNIVLAGIITIVFIFLMDILDINLIRAQPSDDKGYDINRIGDDAFVISSNGYNSMFLVTGDGVIVVDAPPNIGDKILDGLSEVTNETVKYLIYSHAHRDHIGAAYLFPSGIEIVAHKDTLEFLKMANDTNRPLPTQTFVNDTSLILGNTTVQLKSIGPYHQNGNIFIYIPQQKILMVVDQFSPGGTPWKHLATTPHVPSYIQSFNQVLNHDFDVYVSGHGIGTRDDVLLEKEYVDDLKNNADYAIRNVNFTEVTNGVDKNNNAEVTEVYFNAMTDVCANRIDDKWNDRLQGVGVWTDEHCEKMIISLRND